jgi:hypothetical protein
VWPQTNGWILKRRHNKMGTIKITCHNCGEHYEPQSKEHFNCYSCGARLSEFQPEYFSGLNWLEAEKYVGKVMEFSNDALYWDSKDILWELSQGAASRFRSKDGIYFVYCRTCPETFQDPHPTIKITVNGKDYDLPKPEAEAPGTGTKYWICNFILNEIRGSRWGGDDADRRRLLNGIIHLTEDRAKAWADFWKELHGCK